MEQDRYVEIVNRLYSFVNFPFSVINGDYETIYCKPSQIDCFWPKSVLSYLFKKYKETLIPYPFPYIFADEDGIFIGIIPLPDSKYSLIGPVLSHNVNVRNVATRYSKLMTRDELSTLRTISLNCPMTDTVFISNVLSTFYELVYHKVISVDDIIKKNLFTKENNKDIGHSSIRKYTAPISVSASNYFSYENDLSNAIENGDSKLLDALWNSPTGIVLGNIPSAFRQPIFVGLPLLTVMRCATIMGGADVEDAFLVYDSF